jgi:hypothetical protein
MSLSAICIGTSIASNGEKAEDKVSTLNAHEGEYYKKFLPKGKLYMQAKALIDRSGRQVATIAFKLNDGTIVPNIQTLIRYSEDIIIGKIIENKSYLDDNEEIYTVSKVFVQEAAKGDIVSGSVIKIRRQGGSWGYADGVFVTKVPVDARLLDNDKNYIIFLNKGDDDQYYDLSAGVQSIYGMDFSSNSIFPINLNRNDPMVRRYSNALITDFLVVLHKAVENEKIITVK